MIRLTKKLMIIVSGLVFLTGAGAFLSARPAFVSPQTEAVWEPLPGAGKKCPLGDDFYFIYEFSEKPKMGTFVIIVRVFDKSGARVTPFAITGRSGMPSMPGAHDSGEVDFKLNKKNDYLLPVNVVMPGEWEVRLTFLKEGKPVFRGSLKFHV